jgi:malate dehydrogenase (oxaloacetate-decarboxylating)
MSDVYQQSLELHKKFQGKLGVHSLTPIKNRQDLALAYTPGVAEACRVIAKDPMASYDYTMRGRTVAVISDGSAVLGLGNIGPEAAMPVMEGKSLLMKEFGGVDSLPLVIATQEPDEIITFVRQVAPSFAGINLEDISAPRCFYIEEQLQDIGIPVFHDDQHGTAIVVYAALLNAAKVVGKNFADLKVVIVGAGAAGVATGKMLLGIECSGEKCTVIEGVERVKDLVMVDSKGAISLDRTDLNEHKKLFARYSNINKVSGDIFAAMKGADVVIGVSGPNSISEEMIRSMAPKAIVFAMANPTPEIMPNVAQAAGAMVVATGRSDFANQVNNVLAFPGVFRAVVQGRLHKITSKMKYAAAHALAATVPSPAIEQILPDPFFPDLSKVVADAILQVSTT